MKVSFDDDQTAEIERRRLLAIAAGSSEAVDAEAYFGEVAVALVNAWIGDWLTSRLSASSSVVVEHRTDKEVADFEASLKTYDKAPVPEKPDKPTKPKIIL